MLSDNKLFDQFLIEWGTAYVKLKRILQYLNAYSETFSQIKGFRLITAEELDQSQQEWLWLLSLLDNPIETDFYKPCWVPINANEYDQFFDLSSPTLELFQVDYFCFEPYQWFKYPLITHIDQFMFEIDEDPHYFTRCLQKSKEIVSLINSELIIEHNKYGLSGGISYNPRAQYREEILCNELSEDPIIDRKDHSILLSGVNASAILILPGNTKIILDEISFAFEPEYEASTVITNINALAFLLKLLKKNPIKSFFLIFDDCPCNYAWFNEDILYITHSDNDILEGAYLNLNLILSRNLKFDK